MEIQVRNPEKIQEVRAQSGRFRAYLNPEEPTYF